MAADSDSDESYVRFVEQHTDSLLVTAYLLTRDRYEAEDLVQDTFVGLYPKWTKVAAATSSAAYVRRALVNRFLNDQRRQRSAPPAGEGPDTRTTSARW